MASVPRRRCLLPSPCLQHPTAPPLLRIPQTAASSGEREQAAQYTFSIRREQRCHCQEPGGSCQVPCPILLTHWIPVGLGDPEHLGNSLGTEPLISTSEHLRTTGDIRTERKLRDVASVGLVELRVPGSLANISFSLFFFSFFPLWPLNKP